MVRDGCDDLSARLYIFCSYSEATEQNSQDRLRKTRCISCGIAYERCSHPDFVESSQSWLFVCFKLMFDAALLRNGRISWWPCHALVSAALANFHSAPASFDICSKMNAHCLLAIFNGFLKNLMHCLYVMACVFKLLILRNFVILRVKQAQQHHSW